MTVLDNVLVGAHTRTRPFRGGASRERARARSSTTSGFADVADRRRQGCRSGR